jgi:hypothetical protein
MGIGLSLCRSIVESHRGRIKAQNLYNGSVVTGCRFAFTLPVDTTVRHEETALVSSAGEAASDADESAPPSPHPGPAARSIP